MLSAIGTGIAVLILCVGAAAHLVSILIVLVRKRVLSRLVPPPDQPAVSILRPVCGLENYIEETLASTFALDYPRYEIVFCVASPADVVIPLVERLIAAHPEIAARLLVGDDRISGNPKLNNLVKGWRSARYEWIVMADSNVLMPRDYIQNLFARWSAGTGLVASPPIGSRPEGFWSELECAFLNTYQARWQLAADQLGFGFAQGKNMLWRRDILEDAGGIDALAAEMAEDAAATKIVRDAGLKVRLVRTPFPQPLGFRSLAEVWRRQLRWARLRRATFKLYFIPELFAGGFFPLGAAALIAAGGGVPFYWVAALCAGWYGAEVVLARVGRMAELAAFDHRVDRARPRASGALGPRLDGRQLRLARQSDDRGREAADDRTDDAVISERKQAADALPIGNSFTTICDSVPGGNPRGTWHGAHLGFQRRCDLRDRSGGGKGIPAVEPARRAAGIVASAGAAQTAPAPRRKARRTASRSASLVEGGGHCLPLGRQFRLGRQRELLLAEEDEEPGADDDGGADQHRPLRHVAEDEIAEDHRPDDHQILIGHHHRGRREHERAVDADDRAERHDAEKPEERRVGPVVERRPYRPASARCR